MSVVFIAENLATLFKKNTVIEKFLFRKWYFSKSGKYKVENNTLYLRKGKKPLVSIDDSGVTLYFENINMRTSYYFSKLDMLSAMVRIFGYNKNQEQPVFFEVENNKIKVSTRKRKNSLIPIDSFSFADFHFTGLSDLLVITYALFEGLPIIDHYNCVSKVVPTNNGIYLYQKDLTDGSSKTVSVKLNLDPYDILLFYTDKHVSRLYGTKEALAFRLVMDKGFLIEAEPHSKAVTKISRNEEGSGLLAVGDLTIKMDREANVEILYNGNQEIEKFLSRWANRIRLAYSGFPRTKNQLTFNVIIDMYKSYKKLPEDIKEVINYFQEVRITYSNNRYDRKEEEIAGVKTFIKYGTFVKPGYETLLKEFFINQICDTI